MTASEGPKRVLSSGGYSLTKVCGLGFGVYVWFWRKESPLGLVFRFWGLVLEGGIAIAVENCAAAPTETGGV